MKLKIVSLLLVLMILVMQIPVSAVTLLPDPNDYVGNAETWKYWIVIKNGDNIRLVFSYFPISVTMSETQIKFVNYKYYDYDYENNQYIWKYSNTNGITAYEQFEVILQSNHDIAYEDGSGFFFRAEESDPTLPDDDENGFWKDLEDFFSWFNPGSWLSDIVDSVQESVGLLAEPINELREGFSNFIVAMGEIINLLNPWHENFFLRIAFIPSEGYFEEFRTDIKAVFDNKFSFISEIGNFLAFILSSPIIDNPSPPEFKINLPGGKWGTGSVQIIDFSIFEDYRIFIINFMRVLLWIPFLIKLYKRLPSIVY